MKNLTDYLNKEIIILDGAMGTMLQKSGLKAGESPCGLNFTNPAAVIAVHKRYVDAGANIITANTFEANRYKLKAAGLEVAPTVKKAVSLAKEAAGGRAFTALDVGPVGELIAPVGSLSFDECVDIFKEVMTAGAEAGADLIFIETVFDLYELKAAVIAAKEACDLPIFASMTFQENARTFAGCPASAMSVLLDSLGVSALGVNCSVGPAGLYETVKELAAYTSLPLLVKPNAGLPDAVTGGFDVSPKEFAAETETLYSLGVSLFGGCCGTTPEYIKILKETFAGRAIAPRRRKSVSAVCSGTKTVFLDRVRIIGERINPTGKKAFKEALVKNDINYVLKQGLEQVAAGAAILDVNVGMPGIDEAAVMKKVVLNLQSVTDAPLQIDSSNAECIGGALRIYNGKPIVNSVNGEENSMSRVLPMVKKYGAAAVALTLDENGIPDTAVGRFEIAERILERALSCGIKKEDVYIDCLTLAVSAEPDGAAVTLEAVKMIKERLGLKTALGVSNISFGLPNREGLNRSFLNLAIGAGLDLPIINPSAEGMTESCLACNALLEYDTNCADYIASFAGIEKAKKSAAKSNVHLSDNPRADAIGDRDTYGLTQAVINGLTDEASRIAELILESAEPLEIINNCLIPALDRVGETFDTGETFLPQLLKSAEAAKAAFTVINKAMAKTGGRISKGRILLATVKGDIHDIGKNIVKAVLENYGYEIIDLGRDVYPEVIAKAVVEQDIGLAGLSALMTTTLDSMEKTVEAVKAARPSCKIIVGGAVLTESYAKKIGADFYAKDAKAAVDCAKKVFAEL